MFQSDHLRFLEREDGIGWVWLVLASGSPSHTQNPDLATLPAVVGEHGEQRQAVGKDVGKQRKASLGVSHTNWQGEQRMCKECWMIIYRQETPPSTSQQSQSQEKAFTASKTKDPSQRS